MAVFLLGGILGSHCPTDDSLLLSASAWQLPLLPSGLCVKCYCILRVGCNLSFHVQLSDLLGYYISLIHFPECLRKGQVLSHVHFSFSKSALVL